MVSNIIMDTKLEGLKTFKTGKVRDVYDLDDKLLIVATDRLSCFDVVLPNGIPDKGKILTQVALFWFDFFKDSVPNHLITSDFEKIKSCVPSIEDKKEYLDGRMMLVKKAQALPVECVVRGYLAGSGWKEYKSNGTICGIKLPEGLKESDKIPEPIFTPATKAESGHDENITAKRAEEIVGEEVFEKIKSISITLYKKAAEYALSKGIIISDTKFEFGDNNGEIILIDEILTPDSSRFWPKDDYEPGRPQLAFDKQFVRDYLETLDWDKTPPGPNLPDEIIDKTRNRYIEALTKITGQSL